VCEPDSIKLQRGFNTKELFEPETKTLIRFGIRRCSECGKLLYLLEGANECPRLSTLERRRALGGLPNWSKGFFLT